MVTIRSVTAAELLSMPKEGRRYELVAGELRAMPMAGGEHGQIESRLIVSLVTDEQIEQAGIVYPGDTGFFFSHDPEIVLFPDVTFVRAERLPPEAERIGYLDVVPDFVVEIISPSERAGEIKAKVDFYLERGVRLVWVVYPERREVVAHRPDQVVQRFTRDDVLEAGDVFPGFRLPVAEIFRWTTRGA